MNTDHIKLKYLRDIATLKRKLHENILCLGSEKDKKEKK